MLEPNRLLGNRHIPLNKIENIEEFCQSTSGSPGTGPVYSVRTQYLTLTQIFSVHFRPYKWLRPLHICHREKKPCYTLLHVSFQFKFSFAILRPGKVANFEPTNQQNYIFPMKYFISLIFRNHLA